MTDTRGWIKEAIYWQRRAAKAFRLSQTATTRPARRHYQRWAAAYYERARQWMGVRTIAE